MMNAEKITDAVDILHRLLSFVGYKLAKLVRGPGLSNGSVPVGNLYVLRLPYTLGDVAP